MGSKSLCLSLTEHRLGFCLGVKINCFRYFQSFLALKLVWLRFSSKMEATNLALIKGPPNKLDSKKLKMTLTTRVRLKIVLHLAKALAILKKYVLKYYLRTVMIIFNENALAQLTVKRRWSICKDLLKMKHMWQRSKICAMKRTKCKTFTRKIRKELLNEFLILTRNRKIYKYLYLS